jgi:TetR/AcrR family transcriptional repressor of nem operon
MKTTKGEKERLRNRILEKAIPYFKEKGNTGSGINSLMKQAGVTTGALYSHFGSKDDLFVEAVCGELEMLETVFFTSLKRDRKKSLKLMFESYFDVNNYLKTGNGCLYTALGTDMCRCKPSHRARFEEYTQRIYQLFADAIQEQFPDLSPEACYEKSILMYSGCIGAMTMARTIKNKETARKILETGKLFMIQTYIAEENR